jgi:hypothetical protein
VRTFLLRHGIVLALVLALPGLLALSAPQDNRPEPGEQDLYNFEHVYNFNFNEVTGPVGDDSQGTDLEFFTAPIEVAEGVVEDHDFAVVGAHGDGAFIFDITDPENTTRASQVVCRQPRSDPGVHQFTDEDGVLRTVISLSIHGMPCNEAGPRYGNGDGGTALFDVTDPYAPVGLAGLRMNGVHNFAFHPTEAVGYSWTGAIGSLQVDGTNVAPLGENSELAIVDLRAGFDQPTFINIPTIGGPHDGEFNADGSRMYVAMENNYAIYDTTDPIAPQLVSVTGAIPDPPTGAPGATANVGTYAHGVWPSSDGEVMITNNESLAIGGFFASGTGVCPGEGLAFYDIGTDEAAPIGPIGYFEPPVIGRTDKRACTSHFGRPSKHTRVMSVGWYIAGARVIDFTDPTMPREIGAAVMADTPSPFDWGSEVWAAKFYEDATHPEYLYTGDMRRGFDVFRWAGNEECTAPWLEGWTSDCEEGRDITDSAVPVPDDAEQDLFSTLAATEVRGGFSCRLIQFEDQ